MLKYQVWVHNPNSPTNYAHWRRGEDQEFYYLTAMVRYKREAEVLAKAEVEHQPIRKVMIFKRTENGLVKVGTYLGILATAKEKEKV